MEYGNKSRLELHNMEYKMSSSKVTKAVFPVAGFGTRMLPATKSIPKEMLPVVDKPLIQYAVEEAIEAGLEEIIFVTGRNKQAIEDHFDISYELEDSLRKRGKSEALEQVTEFLQEPGRIKYVRQMRPLGLGHAVLCAKDLVGDEPFAIMSTDDLMMYKGQEPCIKQLIKAHEDTGGNIVAVMDVPLEQTKRYGILDTPNQDSERPIIQGLVEKPNPEDAPSTLSITGRYILLPEIFEWLEKQSADKSGEIQLTDAMANMIGIHPFHGLRYKATYFDCGNKLGWLEANIAFAAGDQDLDNDIQSLLKKYIR